MWFSLAKRNGARLVWIHGLRLPFTSYVLTKLLVTSLLSSYKECSAEDEAKLWCLLECRAGHTQGLAPVRDSQVTPITVFAASAR